MSDIQRQREDAALEAAHEYLVAMRAKGVTFRMLNNGVDVQQHQRLAPADWDRRMLLRIAVWTHLFIERVRWPTAPKPRPA